MCGICGELRIKAAKNGSMGGLSDVTAVSRMSATMCDRGPDGDGMWSQGPVALGHRRLKIIDLSGRGSQPMVDPALGLTLVFNGTSTTTRGCTRSSKATATAFSPPPTPRCC